jgi:hypothetical protein
MIVREREREREKGWGRVIVKNATMFGGQGNNIFGFKGSHTVPASPSGRGNACVQD